MKEAIQSPYPKLIFRETFRDEQTCRKNGGEPTNVEFSNGQGSFNGSTSKIKYPLNLNGTYSIRIRLGSYTPTVGLFLYDYRGVSGTGTGYLFINTGLVLTGNTGGTVYVDNVATRTIASTSKEVIVTGTTFASDDDIFRMATRYSESYALNGEIDLFEIYQGTLTPSEVANLYNTWNVEQKFDNTLLDFDSTNGVIELGDLTETSIATDVTTLRQGALFNGSTSMIDTGSDMIGTKAVTIMGWIKPYSITSNDRILDNGKFLFTLGTSNLIFRSDGATGTVSAVSSIVKNKLQFIVVTRTSTGVINFYIGDKDNPPTLSGTINQLSGTPALGTNNVLIGNRSAIDSSFDGLIPKLKIIEGILTLDEITREWSSSRKDIL